MDKRKQNEARPQPGSAGTTATEAKRPYEAPAITRVGNLHEVVGKTGPFFDFALRRPART